MLISKSYIIQTNKRLTRHLFRTSLSPTAALAKLTKFNECDIKVSELHMV